MPQSLPIRILHFADIHIGMENYGRIDPATGINQRVVDFVQRMAEVVDYAIEHEADCVIFAGDAFKTRDPNPTYQREFARQIMRLSSAAIPTVLLVGNHDTPIVEKRATSVDIFGVLDVPHVIVAKHEALHRVETKRGALQIGALPWPQRSRLMENEALRGMNIADLDAELEKKVAEKVGELEAQLDNAAPAILTGHFTVAGAIWGSERNVMVGRDAQIKLSALTSGAWDYVAMGHVHKHQDVSKGSGTPVIYSGSLERIDFGEEREAKGFCWVEALRGATRWQFVPVAVRPFITVAVDVTDSDDPTERVLREVERHDVTGAIVRVRIRLNQSQESQIRAREIEDALSAAHLIAGIGKDVVREIRNRIGVENPETLEPQELLERYLLSKGKDAGEVAEMLRLAQELIQNDPSQTP
jgi:DNA repair protein SbcD/Mre11